jgi:hypothetical protein
VNEIETYLRRSDLASVGDLIGALDVPPERGVIRAGRAVDPRARRGSAS